jgi:hypothetical protein
MKTKMKDFFVIQNRQAANAYMDEVAKESNFTAHHKGYPILPHKIHQLLAQETPIFYKSGRNALFLVGGKRFFVV